MTRALVNRVLARRPISVRGLLVRALVRGTLKPILHPWVPLGLQRRLLRGCSAMLPRPGGLRTGRGSLGPLEALHLSPLDAGAGAAMLYVHGGGFCTCSASIYHGLAGRLALAAGMPVWLVDYPLAPEHPYPAALDGIRAAYLALLDQGQDPEGLVVAGDSAGGGLVLSLLLALGRDGLPPPACGVLLSPWLDLTLSGTSMRGMRSRDPMLPVRWLERCARRYAGGKPLGEASLSPLNADLRDLPPLLLQVGSEEVLLSDSLRLALRLSAAGQPFDLEIREGCWHVWHLFAPWIPEAGAAIDAAAAHARRHLGAREPVDAALAEGRHGGDHGGRLSRRA